MQKVDDWGLWTIEEQILWQKKMYYIGAYAWYSTKLKIIKLLWTEKQKHGSFLSLLCHHSYCIFDGKVLCIMRGTYSMVCTIKSLTNIEAFQEKNVFILTKAHYFLYYMRIILSFTMTFYAMNVWFTYTSNQYTRMNVLFIHFYI